MILFFVSFVLFVINVSSLEIVSRNDWGAKPPKAVEWINETVPFVIVHHSYLPSACYSIQNCSQAMRGMQRFHQDDRGWADIGYTFAVGGDGKVYEGRGFDKVGAHAPIYNRKSIGICLIGDWQVEVPPKNMLLATQELISHAIKLGYLSKDYTLLGHKQVRNTICPGPALFNEIQSWPQFGSDIKFESTNQQSSVASMNPHINALPLTLYALHRAVWN